ncbi:uncharacterized protein [Haliotis cracherodii]|uniref:uncharacterized protein n=1 Tax=Haliotis cracherodii TaxID=6455 RepID=UPI0039E90DF8
MKCLLLLVSAVVTVMIVNGEPCNVDSDCVGGITSCSDGSDSVCINGQCTCTSVCDPEPNLGRCFGKNMCVQFYEGGRISCDCPNHIANLHCIDGECHCGYPSGN